MGYVSKELVAIDGCKIKANASKKFTGNYESFLKKKRSYEKMIKNLLDRAKLVERDEKNKEEELRRIDRLSKNYNQSLSKINEFINNCNEEGKKSRDQKIVTTNNFR